MSPQPNVEHQRMVKRLVVVLSEVIREADGGDVFPGVNLSDRTEGWEDNYRSPDVAVFLPGNRAEEFESHYRGPADFLIEIVSPSDKSREKIPFYQLSWRARATDDRSLSLVVATLSAQWRRTCLGGPIEREGRQNNRQHGRTA